MKKKSETIPDIYLTYKCTFKGSTNDINHFLGGNAPNNLNDIRLLVFANSYTFVENEETLMRYEHNDSVFETFQLKSISTITEFYRKYKIKVLDSSKLIIEPSDRFHTTLDSILEVEFTLQ